MVEKQGSIQLANETNGFAGCAIPRREAGDPCPLSFSQQRLWFLDQLSPADSTYNIPYVMTIEGELNAEALQHGLDAVVARHEVLRTVFKNVDGTPMTAVIDDCRVPLRQVDLTTLPEAERQAKAHLLLKREACRGFNLARDCMLRGLLVRMAKEKYLFLHVSHHIAWEFRSTALLYAELEQLYGQFMGGQVADLPELPIQYSDFALWQRRLLQSDRLQRLSEYWKQQLADRPGEMHLPTDFPRPAVPSRGGKRYPIVLSAELLEAASTLSRQSGVTPFTSLCAAFSVFLYAYTGQRDICVGSPIAPRRRQEIEPLIGFFVNTLVLRSQVCATSSFRDLLGQLSRAIVDAIAHVELPFDKLVEILRPPRRPGRIPLFQVNFRVVKEPVPALRLQGVQVSAPEWINNETSKFDLSLELVAKGGAVGFFEYSTDLFRLETIALMAADFPPLLQALIADPDIPIEQSKTVTEIRARLQTRVI